MPGTDFFVGAGYALLPGTDLFVGAGYALMPGTKANQRHTSGARGHEETLSISAHYHGRITAMPRRSIAYAPGEYYHLVNRGSLRHVLFHDAETYGLFASLLEYFGSQCSITVVAYCLMPNHFHLLVRVEPGGDLSMFMQKVCCRFSNIINRRLRRSGTIFQGRFRCKHVSSTRYLQAVCRYIHLNPVVSGLCQNPEDYEYSTYRETIGSRAWLSCDPSIIRNIFRGEEHYKAFVAAGKGNPKIGDDDLLRDLAEMKLL